MIDAAELASAVEESHVAFDVVDATGRFAYVNRAYCELWGYAAPEEIIGTSPETHCVDPAQPAKIIAEVNARGRCEFTFEARRKDGSSFLCRMRVAALTRPDGTRVYHGFSEDVSDIARAREALKQSEERLRAAGRAGVVGVWDWNIKANALYFDSVMLELYGLSENSFGGNFEAWISRVHPDDAAYVRGEIDAALAGRREYQPEFRAVLPDGTLRYVKARSQTKFDAGGNAVRMIGVNYDITGVKEAERELERLNQGLERQVKLRTQELEQARLVAESASIAKTNFLANMSHELRTPLNGILGFAELAQDRVAEPQVSKWLGVVVRSAKHLNRLIDDLLDISQIEAGVVELKPAPTRLQELIAGVSELIAPLAQEAGLAFRTHLDETLAGLALELDAVRLKQVLLNLLSNAIKFTREGEVALRVERLGGDPAAMRVRFAVSDTGAGIREEDRERIFNLFEQVDNSSTREAGGTGLGLAISRRIARAMGAELCVESEYGKGSTFALTGAFPAFAVVSEKDSERAERMTALKARCAGLRALVVDDDITAQDLATVLLHRLGCEVDRAHDGLVCLEQAAARHYDLVIMDWHMPNLDGLATLAELRRLEDYHDVPVLAVTAKAQESDREACLEAGMCGYIAKPLDVDAFYSELQNCLMAERCAG